MLGILVRVMVLLALGAAVAGMGPAQPAQEQRTAAPETAAERRVALVIGNARYVNAGELANPVNDANDIANALRGAGFEVILGLDLDKRGFDKTLRTFSRSLASADVALLFYAGHGLQVAGQNYLVPVDAELADERDLDFEAVRLEFVLSQMELGREDKTNLVFLDACRDNPLARNLRRSMGTRSAALGRGLAEVRTGVGTFVSYSTQPGNVALDGDSRNSPFTSALARHIGVPGRNINGVMIEVRKDVIKATDGRQVPWDHSALTGDFYFHRASAPGALAGRAPAAPQGADVAALAERLRQIEAELKRKAELADAAAASSLGQLKARAADLERANRADQQKIFDVMRKMSRETDGQARIALSRENHALSVEMARRGQELKALKEEIAALEGTAPARASAASGECVRLAKGQREAIPLVVGSKVCAADGAGHATVKQIAERAIAFAVSGGRDFTCKAGETCQFDWPGAPVFTVRAEYDPARGIEGKGEMVPQ